MNPDDFLRCLMILHANPQPSESEAPMNLLLTMSVSGTLVLLLYCLFSRIGKHVFPVRWRYGVLKLSMMFFALPLGIIITVSRSLCRRIFPDPAAFPVVITGDSPTVLLTGWGPYRNLAAEVRLAGLTIWGFIAFSLFCFHLCRYVRNKKALFRCLREITDEITQDVFSLPALSPALSPALPSLLQSFSRQPIRFYATPLPLPPFTIGVWRPCVILSETLLKELPKEDLGTILRHELIHIQRHDALIKWFCQLLVIIHWFNPLVYLLRKSVGRLSELTCDSLLAGQMDGSSRRQYGRLLIMAATSMTTETATSVITETAASAAMTNAPNGSSAIPRSCISPFSGDARFIKERLTHLMASPSVNPSAISARRTAKLPVLLFLCLLLCFLCGAAPSLSYEPTRYLKYYQEQPEQIHFYGLEDRIVCQSGTVLLFTPAPH